MATITCPPEVARRIAAILSDPIEETCCFLVGTQTGTDYTVVDAWPTPNISQRPRDHYYAIGASSWHQAKDMAQAIGLRVIGHGHSHVAGNACPSSPDTYYIRAGEVGCVYHVRTGVLTWYTKAGQLRAETVKRSPLRRLIAFVLCD